MARRLASDEKNYCTHPFPLAVHRRRMVEGGLRETIDFSNQLYNGFESLLHCCICWNCQTPVLARTMRQLHAELSPVTDDRVDKQVQVAKLGSCEIRSSINNTSCPQRQGE